MITLYGTSMSRAGRCLWALEELGLQYEHNPIGFTGETRKPEYLKINPNGHIPALDDNGVAVWESMAINLYLAEKYGKSPLWPSSVQDHAHTYQWSFWGMTEVEPQLMAIFLNRMMLPEAQRSEQAAKNAETALQAPLKVLDQHLNGREYLLGKDFTIADLNVASVMLLIGFLKLDISGFPRAAAWFNRCTSRPANQRAGSKK